MTHLIIKNNIDPIKLEALINFLKIYDIDAQIKKDKVAPKKECEFTLAAGIWKDRNIDANELRKQAWARNK